MAAGKINLQANDGKVAGVVFEDGASSNVTVTVPKEGGEFLTTEGNQTIAGVKTFSSAIVGTLIGNQSLRANTASAQAIAANTWTKILFDVIDFDVKGNFSSSRFTAQKAGYYTVCASCRVMSTTGLSTAIYKNGVLISFCPIFAASAGSLCSHISDTVKLNVGDYIEIYVSSALGTTLHSNGSNNFISINFKQEL